jgi:hypothetical protein
MGLLNNGALEPRGFGWVLRDNVALGPWDFGTMALLPHRTLSPWEFGPVAILGLLPHVIVPATFGPCWPLLASSVPYLPLLANIYL